MVLVPSSLELAQLQQHFTPNDPVILQEFIPHDGVLVKVYFAYPDHVFIFFRPSFKNIDQGRRIVSAEEYFHLTYHHVNLRILQSPLF